MAKRRAIQLGERSCKISSPLNEAGNRTPDTASGNRMVGSSTSDASRYTAWGPMSQISALVLPYQKGIWATICSKAGVSAPCVSYGGRNWISPIYP